MHWYRHHIGDWSRDTGHLSILESGAYAKLIAVYYRTESPLPLDLSQICKLAGCRTPQDRNAVQSILKEFFSLQTDGYHQKRCDAEIAHYYSKSAKARESVMHRWAKLSTGKKDTNVIRTQYERDTNQEPRTNKDLDLPKSGPLGGNGKGQNQGIDGLPVNVKTIDPPDIEKARHIAELVAQGDTEGARQIREG